MDIEPTRHPTQAAASLAHLREKHGEVSAAMACTFVAPALALGGVFVVALLAVSIVPAILAALTSRAVWASLIGAWRSLRRCGEHSQADR